MDLKRFVLLILFCSLVTPLPALGQTRAPSYTENKRDTNARAVCSTTSGNSALVVIDMQPYFANRNGFERYPDNKAKVDRLLKFQVEAIKKAREQRIPIIFIEYDCRRFMIDCGGTDAALLKAAEGYQDVSVIKKDTDGMFSHQNTYRSELVKHLQSRDIGNLLS